MALNWDAIRKQNAATGRTIPVATKPATVTQPVKPSHVPTRTQAPKTITTARGKTVAPVNDRTRYNEATRTGYANALQTNAGARAFAGFQQGLSLFDLEKQIAEQYGQETLDALQGSKAYTAGEVGGMVAQFAGGYGAAAPKIGSALAKVPAFAKAGKIGQGVAKSVATDLAVGLPLNANIAYNKEGLQGDDAIKNIALNTAIDLVAGGVLEVLPSAVKGIKKLVNKQTKEVVAEIPEEFAEAIAKGKDATGGMPEVSAPQDVPAQGSVRPAQRVSPQSDTIVPLAKDTPLKQAENNSMPIKGLFTDYAPTQRASDVAKANDFHSIVDEVGVAPEELVTIYRGAPKSQSAINDGDWVTTVKQLADDYAGNGHVLEIKVPAKNLYAPKGEGIEEIIYSTKQRDGMVDLGADLAMPVKQADQLIDEYGAFPQGMQPAVDGRPIPKATDMGEVQQGMRTIAEAPTVNAESYKEITTAIEEGSAWKPTILNETVVNKANDTIAKDGLDVAYGKFSAVLSEGRQAKSEDIALGYRLLQEYQAQGNYKRVADIAVDVSEMLSESGRSLQAARIIKQLTPEGRLMSVQRVAKRLSEQNGVKIDLDDEIVKDILTAEGEEQIFAAQKKAVEKMWKVIPSGALNRINSWRYMSMLMNPKTHVRNIVGNALFLPARETKNIVGAALEKIAKVPVGQRTKAIINPFNSADKALLDFADKDFAKVLPILGGTRLDDAVRPLEAKVYNTKWLEWLRKGNLEFMSKTDDAFKRVAYNSSLAQYMKANKLNPATITPKQLAIAREYAGLEAMKSTYQDVSTLSKAIGKLKKNLSTVKGSTPAATAAKRVGSAAVEGIIPFSKTPINLLRRGIEYSPVGLASGMADVISAARKGKGVAQALDKLASGMTGSGVMLLGYYMAKSGVVVGGSEEPYTAKGSQFDRLMGIQEYAIDTGEGTYTIEWMAPMSMPFFVGVEMAKSFDTQGLAAVADAITSIDEPVMNMSMLKGINDAFRTYSQEEGALGQIGTNMVLSYLGQFVPTLSGQIARTADDTRRTSVSTKEDAFARKIDKAVQQQQGKIPVLNQRLEPYINLWGETESSNTAFQNFLNPGYYKEKSTSALDKEIQRVSESAGEEGSKAIPRLLSGYTITADKKDYRLTEKELTRFKEIQGKESKKGAEALIRSSAYKGMSDEAKAKALDKVYSDAFQTAKWTILKQRSVFPNKN
jgi:hypothetical protein